MVFVKSINGDCLLVVDCQNDFVQGTPHALDGAAECLTKVNTLVKAARLYGVPVIWAVLEHSESGVDAEQSRRHLFSAGSKGICIAGTPGAALAQPLKANEGEVYLRRTRTSAFFATSLDVTLRRLGVARVVVCGLNTPTSVRCSAFDAIALDYSVSVLRDATLAHKQYIQDSNLADTERAGAAVVGTELYIATLVAKSLSPASLVTGAGEGLTQSLHLAGTGFALAGEGLSAMAGGLAGGLQHLGGLFGMPGAGQGDQGGAAGAEAGKAGAEREREEREKAERERERERAERERAEREKAEKERAEKEKAEREKALREKAEREKAEKERKEREKGGDAPGNPLAAQFMNMGAVMGLGKEAAKPAPSPGKGAHAWPSLSNIQQAFHATGSAVADFSQQTVKATESAYKATEGAVVGAAKATEDAYKATEGAVVGAAKATEKAVQDGASKTASFVSDTTAKTVAATTNAAEAIGKGATTPLKGKKSPSLFGGS